LKGAVERAVHEFLRLRCAQTKGVFLHAIGGTDTHIHMALSIQPFVSISDLVGDLKGASSRKINRQRGFKVLYWQRGFGVVSFGRKNLTFVAEYIAKQKEHHAEGTPPSAGLENAAGGTKNRQGPVKMAKALNPAEAGLKPA